LLMIATAVRLLIWGGGEGKLPFVCLSGDIRRLMLEKLIANNSKEKPNTSLHDVAAMMLRSVISKRANLIDWARRLDETMEIGEGKTTIQDLLSMEIPTRIKQKASKKEISQNMVGIWVVLLAVLKKQKLRRSDHHNLQSYYMEFMVWIETSSQ
jgi:hypothetical protein